MPAQHRIGFHGTATAPSFAFPGRMARLAGALESVEPFPNFDRLTFF